MKKAIAIVVLALIAASFLFCSPVYVIRAGVQEAKILGRRQEIEAVVRDTATAAWVRHKLELVLDARTFAKRQLGLDVGDSYTTYARVDHDTLLMVVSGARKDAFVPYTWWFPIVGRVPYKGYFDFERAYAEGRKLDRKGYDSYVRPSGAFSTLGWFNDPVLSTILRYDDVSLANTVIHELTHNTLYLSGQAAFNESFANFVGGRGAEEYFCRLEGADGPHCKQARDDWADNLVFGAYLEGLVDRLEKLYARTDLTPEQKVAARGPIFQDARTRYEDDVAPKLRGRSFRYFLRRPLNNATLIGTRLYYRHLDWFEDVYRREGALKPAIDSIIATAKKHRGDPYAGLAVLADTARGGKR
ncbi:MAG TPA: aminopeptidase [Longimicrobiales bacterium]|nr:aminopeptidase [Longimicrobiales bacterium]